jgi:c-di-GMP-binding flagellar brake protein YcgR
MLNISNNLQEILKSSFLNHFDEIKTTSSLQLDFLKVNNNKMSDMIQNFIFGFQLQHKNFAVDLNMLTKRVENTD